MSFSKILVICLYTETVKVDQFSELATLVLAPCTRHIAISRVVMESDQFVPL